MSKHLYNSMNKISLLMILFIVLLLQTNLYSQSGKITGIVIDKVSQETLYGANVMIIGSTMGAAADIEGEFVIPFVPYGTHVVAVRYIGYQEHTFVVDINAQNSEQDFTIELEAEIIEGETVVITAQAQGQVAAIQQQLSADQIANVVSEQKLQELPDFNAASALSRLPGVSTTQSSGEDNKIVIRGLAPQYNAVQIEGVRMSSTGSSQIGLSSNPGVGSGSVSNDRSVDLTSISPYMIRTIAVYKSLTPDMDANAIGGTVNMELREAPEETRFDLLYQQGYTAKSSSFGNFRLVGSGSSRFFDNQLGVYALANIEAYDRNSDNLGANYDIVSTDVSSSSGYRPVKVSSVTFNRHIETRKRYGGNLILDYRLPNGSLKFTNMYSRIESDYNEHRQNINYNNGRMEWTMKRGENAIDQQMHSLKLDYDLDFMTSDISISYSGSKNNLENAPQVNLYQRNALKAGEIRDNVAPQDLTYLLTEYRGDQDVILASGNLFTSKYKESRLTFKADFEIPFSLSTALNGTLKFGGQMYNQENEIDQETPYLAFNGSSDSEADNIQANMIRDISETFGIPLNDQGFMTGDYLKNSDSELYESFLDDEYGKIFYVSNDDLLSDIIAYVISKPEYDASNRQSSDGAKGGWYDGPYQSLTNDYNYKEDYYAGYGMAKVNWLDFTIIGGIRFEKVESEYFAYNARDMRNAQGQVMYDTTAITQSENWLPMAQIKYQPFNFLDVRYAYTHTLARPSYHSLSPKFTITQGSQGRVYTGNPNLKPAEAENHDLNFTFHSNTLGLFTIGGFYKNIEGFVYSAEYQLDVAEDAGIDNIDNYTIIRDGAKVVEPNTNAIVSKPLNNPNDAIVKGIELDFQHNFWYAPSPFNNIVFGINYARIWSETSYPWYDVGEIIDGRDRIKYLIDSSSTGRLIDQPDHVLNSYIGYDYEGFSARITARFQDNTLRGTGGRNKENVSFTTESLRWDLSARQKLPWYDIEVFLDVNNLTSNNAKWIQQSINGFRGIQNYGLTANLGVRFKY